MKYATVKESLERHSDPGRRAPEKTHVPSGGAATAVRAPSGTACRGETTG